MDSYFTKSVQYDCKNTGNTNLWLCNKMHQLLPTRVNRRTRRSAHFYSAPSRVQTLHRAEYSEPQLGSEELYGGRCVEIFTLEDRWLGDPTAVPQRWCVRAAGGSLAKMPALVMQCLYPSLVVMGELLT